MSTKYSAALLCASAVASVSPAFAINIAEYTPEKNDLFSSGFTGAAPVRNTSPNFVGAGYDWTPIGWVTDQVGGRVGHVNLVSPLHSAGARHSTISLRGTNARFVGAMGKVVDVPIPSYAETSALAVPGFSPDLEIVTLKRAVTAADAVTPLRLLDVSNEDYQGFPMLLVGSDDPVVGSQVASGRVYGITHTALHSETTAHDSSLSFSSAEPGDSGSPLFITHAGKLTLAATMLTGDGGGNSLLRKWTYSSSAPLGPPYIYYDPVPSMNARLAAAGYALKWTIYDVPADSVHTANRWTGAASSGDFGTAGNWSSGAVPASGSATESLPVVFDGSVSVRQIEASGRFVRGMLFRPGSVGAGFTITASSAFTIGFTGIRNESSATQTFSAPLALSGSQNWEAVNGALAFTGPIDTAGNLAVVGGARDTTIAGVMSGAGALAKDDTGTLTLQAINAYAGSTFLHNGTLRLGPAANLPATTLAFVAGNEAILDLAGRNQTFSDITSSYGGTGRILLGGATLTVNPAGTSAYLGTIEGSGKLVKTGAGTWTVSGTNSSTQPLEISAGTLRAMAPAALPGANLVFSGGVLELGFDGFTRPLGTGDGELRFTASGGFGAVGANRIVNLGGAGAPLTWGAGEFVPNGSALVLAGAGSDATLEFRNPINLDGAARAVVTNDGSAAIDARIAAPLGNGSLTKAGAGVLQLASANTYAGATTIEAGALLASDPAALGTGNLRLSGGTILLGAGDLTRPLGTGDGQVSFTATGGFGAQGADRRVNFGNAGGVLRWGANHFVPLFVPLQFSSVASDATLIFEHGIDLAANNGFIQVANGSAPIDARITGPLSNGGLVKTGSGALELTGANTYTGATIVNGGSLLLGGASSLAPANVSLNFSGVLVLGTGDFSRALGTAAGEVRFPGAGGFAARGADRTVNIGGAGATLTWGQTNFVPVSSQFVLGSSISDATLIWQNPLDLAGANRTIVVDDGPAAVEARLAGVLSNGGLNKQGGGVLELAAANTYAGSTVLAAGGLRLSHPSALPSGNLQIGGGVLELAADDFTRALGSGVNQFSLSSGGFSAAGGTRVVNIGGAAASLLWQSGTSAAVFMRSGSVLTLALPGASGTLDFRNPIKLGNLGEGARTIRVENGSAEIDARFSGVLSSDTRWGFTKTGGGRLELSATNTYTGQTIIEAGALRLTGSVTNTSTVEVKSGAVLELAGSLTTGTLYVRAGAVLRGQGTINANLVNEGSVVVSGTGQTLVIGKPVTNTGLFVVSDSARLDVTGAFVNQGTLDMGTAAAQALPSGLTGSGAVVAPPAPPAPNPLLEFTFDGTGTTATNIGTVALSGSMVNKDKAAVDLHGAPGSGLTGVAADRAFDNSSATGMGGAGAGGGIVVGTHADINNLRSFTLQGWFKAPVAIGTNARLFDMHTGTSGFMLRGDGSVPGRLVLSAEAENATSETGYDATNQWVFFAVTYDGTVTTNNVRFYVGTADRKKPLALVGAPRSIGVGSVAASSYPLIVGNATSASGFQNYRPFDGLLDNLRLYGAASGSSGALTLEQLEAVRLADIGDDPIAPEVIFFIDNGEALLLFDSLLDQRYQLQRSTTLAADSWSDTGVPLDGTGDELILFDTLVPSDPRVFYRILVTRSTVQ